MGDHLGEVVAKLLKADVIASIAIHHGETEHVSFVLCAIAEDVHDHGERFEIQEVVSIGIKDLKYAISQKRRRLLAKEAHLGAELLLVHSFNGALHNLAILLHFELLAG